MGKLLSSRQIDAYHEQGFVAPVDLFSEAEAAIFLQRLQQAEGEYPECLNASNRNNPHLAFSCLDELAHHPRVLDAVEDLIGPSFSLWGSVLFIKDPHSEQFVSWHQDATYMGIEPHNFVTPWIALTPSNRETGCMSMIPGSHRDAIRPHIDTFGEHNILTRGQCISAVDDTQMVDLELRPGQMSLHHARVIHGSQPNCSDQRRVGFALQSYMPSGARQTLGENLWLPMRGDSQHPDLVRLRRPAADMAETAGVQRECANRNFSDILYHGARQRRAY